MNNDKIYTPKHSGGGIVFCSNCDKSFVDNSYYEFCPRCGCRIRYPKNTTTKTENNK